MIRILVINDVHLAASPPLGCTDLYVADVKNMLTEARQYAVDNGCAYTVFTGDIFHSKRNVPHGLVRWMVELLQGWPGRKLAIVGNHDLSFAGQASVPTQPIGVLFQSGALEWLKEDLVTCDRIVTPNGPTMSSDLFIQWSPANYRDDIDHNPWNYGLTRRDAQQDIPRPREDARSVDWAIKVAHGTITVPGKPYPFHIVPMDTIPTEGMDICLFGHPHYDVGIHTVNGCTFACLGSIGRTQNNEDNEKRMMRLLQVQLGKDEVAFDELLLTSAAPASELFLTKGATKVQVSKSMRLFVRSIEEATRLEEGSLDEVLAGLGGETVDARARLRLIDYLDRAGING